METFVSVIVESTIENKIEIKLFLEMLSGLNMQEVTLNESTSVAEINESCKRHSPRVKRNSTRSMEPNPEIQRNAFCAVRKVSSDLLMVREYTADSTTGESLNPSIVNSAPALVP